LADLAPVASPPAPRLRSAQQLDLAAGWHMPEHSHADFNELILVVDGTIEVLARGERLVGTPGSVLVYPRHLPHTEHADGGARLTTLYITWHDPPGAAAPTWPALVHDTTGRMQGLIRWMFELQPVRGEEQQRAVDAMLQAILYAYVHQAPHPHDQLVGRVKHYVQRHLAEPISLDDLAATVAMSKFHFTRVFQRAAGQPPMAFVRRLRVEAARTLLLTSALPLREVAPRVGFADEFQLSRVFSRVAGHPPSALRQLRAR
jgi:AraC-like DNA-binding protein